MMKLFLDCLYFTFCFYLIMFVILMLMLIPESPVNYLIYMLFFSLFLFLYSSFMYSTNLYMYMYLIIAGGIMVTFLFFMVFNYKLMLNISLIYYLFFMFMLMLLMLFLYLFNWTDFSLLFKYNENKSEDNLITNCYIESSSMMLTLFSMTYLLFVMYLIVKISTNLKSSPMRNLM